MNCANFVSAIGFSGGFRKGHATLVELLVSRKGANGRQGGTNP